jgi:hypothetical protein
MMSDDKMVQIKVKRWWPATGPGSDYFRVR